MVDKFPPRLSTPPELLQLLENIKKKRGSSSEWLEKEIALMKTTADIGDYTRVLCKGDWLGPDQHLPAVLVYCSLAKEIKCLGFKNISDTVVTLDVHYFYSGIPYTAIAQEVLSGDETKVISQ